MRDASRETQGRIFRDAPPHRLILSSTNNHGHAVLNRLVLTLIAVSLDCLPLHAASLPQLATQGTSTQLIVGGKPLLMIAGELHNSSASTLEYVEPLLGRVRRMHANTVLAPIAWDQFEPNEGEYDYTLIDGLIGSCHRNDLKLVVLWFATWKNGQSTYAPLWVKRDTDRFKRVLNREAMRLETLSPFCDATREADSRAFGALMRRVAEVDEHGTVVMAQPENEAGIFSDMDYSNAALSAFDAEVPPRLVRYLNQRKDAAGVPVFDAWRANGERSDGAWREVFGDSAEAREFLLAWQTADFINSVAEAGRREHRVPMFVNAWLVQSEQDAPGVYPNGGPVARVMDIYKAAAPELFTLAPDIYLPNFKAICSRYVRADNPLLIPESTVDAGRAFYAFAEHDAMCYAPFGIEERASGDAAFQAAYGVLNELHDTIAAHQGKATMRGLLRESDERSEQLTLGGYRLSVFYESDTKPCYGLVINTAEDEFLVAGVNLRIEFRLATTDRVGYIGHVQELRREGDAWRVVRVLNGDETFHHSSLRVFGRDPRVGYDAISPAGLGPQPTAADSFESLPAEQRLVRTPGIYRVQTYKRAR